MPSLFQFYTIQKTAKLKWPSKIFSINTLVLNSGVEGRGAKGELMKRRWLQTHNCSLHSYDTKISIKYLQSLIRSLDRGREIKSSNNELSLAKTHFWPEVWQQNKQRNKFALEILKNERLFLNLIPLPWAWGWTLSWACHSCSTGDAKEGDWPFF